MAAKITQTVTVTGTTSAFAFGDLVALVDAGEKAGVSVDARVALRVDHGGHQLDPGTSTLTLSLSVDR